MSSVAVACYLRGRCKDLSAPLYISTVLQLFPIAAFEQLC